MQVFIEPFQGWEIKLNVTDGRNVEYVETLRDPEMKWINENTITQIERADGFLGHIYTEGKNRLPCAPYFDEKPDRICIRMAADRFGISLQAAESKVWKAAVENGFIDDLGATEGTVNEAEVWEAIMMTL